MKKFLRVLRAARIERHVPDWQADLGPELIALLVGLGILEDAGDADWYLCGHRGGDLPGCPRAIVPSGRTDVPYLAVCGNGNDCADIPIAEGGQKLLATSFVRFVAVLRRLYHVTDDAGAASPPELQPDVFLLGASGVGPAQREIVLALDTSSLAFAYFLATRERQARPTLVIATRTSGLAPHLLDRHAPGGHVELQRLEDDLVVRDGKLARRAIELRALPAETPSATSPEPIAPARGALEFVLHTQDGTRRIDRASYEALRDGASETFDLFLDIAEAAPVAGRTTRFTAQRRRRDGRWEKSLVSATEGAALVELMERRGYVAPKSLRALAGTSPKAAMKLVQRARVAVDEAPWLLFPVDPATSGRDLAYKFAPPSGLRFAIIKRST